MKNKNTTELLSILNSINNPSRLKDYISNSLEENSITIAEFFNNICSSKNISKSKLISEADIDRTYGYQILNGSKNPSRDNIIKLSIAAKLTLEETDRALTIGKYGKLYPKKVKDSIIIFAINNKLSLLDVNILLDENGEAYL